MLYNLLRSDDATITLIILWLLLCWDAKLLKFVNYTIITNVTDITTNVILQPYYTM